MSGSTNLPHDKPLSITVNDAIKVRDLDLADDLIGAVSFTQALLLDIDGELPSPEKVRMVDAILVAVMEHGITPSTLAGRLILDGAPEALQGAVAGGLLATGSRFLGTIEQAADVVQAVVDRATEEGVPRAAEVVVRELREAKIRVPGVGHNLHGDVDPRVESLIKVARELGVAGEAVVAFEAIVDEVSRTLERTFLPNAAGVIGALLIDLGYEPREARGFALIARCAGMVAHCLDEWRRPIARGVWSELHHDLSAKAEGEHS